MKKIILTLNIFAGFYLLYLIPQTDFSSIFKYFQKDEIKIKTEIIPVKNLPEETDKKINKTEILGDLMSIEEVFLREKNKRLQHWKQKILTELHTNLNLYRNKKKLSQINLGLIESFAPSELYKVIKEKPGKILLLDVREAVEFDFYKIPTSFHFRYGDLANNIMPKIDKNKKIVVVCHSGIRGFLTANLLKSQGFENIAFIRGGLGEWEKEKFPLIGDIDDFKFLSQKYNRLEKNTVQNSSLAKIDFRFQENIKNRSDLFQNTHFFYEELATSKEMLKVIEDFKKEKIILVCSTESECFDARAFSYLFEENGGRILGFIKL